MVSFLRPLRVVSWLGAGAHHIEFEAPQTEENADLKVDAYEGNGTYHLSARVIGTVENMVQHRLSHANFVRV